MFISVQEATGASDWSSVVAGNSHTVALKTDGSVWSWGWGGNGLLGNGTTANSSSPVQEATGASDWSSVVTGIGVWHTVALKTDGSLWSWGLGNKGQLGNGTTANSTIPVQEATGAYWSSVVVGGSYTVALK